MQIADLGRDSCSLDRRLYAYVLGHNMYFILDNESQNLNRWSRDPGYTAFR